MARVLVIHDDLGELRHLARRLAPVAQVVTTTSPTRALHLIASHELDVIVAAEPIARQLRARFDGLVSVEPEVVHEPSGPQVVALALERQALRRENARLAAQIGALHDALDGERLATLVQDSLEMRAVVARARLAASSGATVLVVGERGVGKRALARAIHREHAAGRLVRVDGATIAEARFEAALFGHADEPGGLVERARGGTLLLDEVGTLPRSVQARLATALRDRAYRPVGAVELRPLDTRVIATTSIELRGRVCDELVDRLDIVAVAIPPLRDRPADIVPLAERFLGRHRRGAHPTELSAAARDAVVAYDWPGNAAELELEVRRALAVSTGAPLALHLATRGAAFRATRQKASRRNAGSS